MLSCIDMLSLARTKELIGEPTMTDAEAERLRDAFRSLAEIAFDQWQTHGSLPRPLIRGDPN